MAASLWPESELASLWRVDGCESSHGLNPHTYDLGRANGGRLQLNRRTWEPFFRDRWTWEEIVMDDAINLEAAHVVWTRGGWAPWTCWSIAG